MTDRPPVFVLEQIGIVVRERAVKVLIEVRTPFGPDEDVRTQVTPQLTEHECPAVGDLIAQVRAVLEKRYAVSFQER